MKTILIGGGTGLVGQRIVELYRHKYKFNILTRSPRQGEQNVSYYKWDLKKMEIDPAALKCDYIINLTGAGIADKRWTAERKKILINSRVDSNKLLAQGLRENGGKVESIASASAIGYYGDRGNEILDESSSLGSGFLAECCQLWEDSSNLLRNHTQSQSVVRISVVLSMKDGALPKLLMTKKAGVMSYFGKGDMYYSWIHIDDLAHLFIQTLESDYDGVINAVAPESIPNKEFTAKVKEGVKANAILIPAPTFAIRIAMGEMADVVLNSTRVISTNIKKIKFEFKYPNLVDAVRNLKENNV